MRDISVVVLTGRLTKDSTLQYTKSGTPISRFSIAVNCSVKQGDEWKDEASFFEIDYWGKGAEGVNRYLTKGQQVGVEGELRQDRWEQDGQSRSKIIVNASNVRLLGQGGAQGQSGGNSHQEGQQSPAGANEPGAAAKPTTPPADDFDDDIPF